MTVRWIGVILGILVLMAVGAVLFKVYTRKAADEAAAQGRVAYDNKDYALALNHYQRAVKLNPNTEHFIRLAAVYLKQKRYPEGIDACTRAITRIRNDNISPERHAALYAMRGIAYEISGRQEEATKDFEISVSMKPDSRLYNTMAWHLATTPDPGRQDGARAVKYALDACKMENWTNASHIDTLAAAHARAGNFSEAIKYQKQAISMETDPNDLQEYRERLNLYRNSKAYSEKPGKS